jgi:hypothetical protein
MGFFSWKTADTNESIANTHAQHELAGATVYLIQPDGQQAIMEPGYEGYGEFGGVDAYEWLALQNFDKDILDKAKEVEDGLRSLAISCVHGSYFEDIETGKKFAYNLAEFFDDIEPFRGTYDMPIAEYNKSPNDLIKEGIWIEKSFSDRLTVTKPLKFSYDKNAVYEDLPASEDCEAQGFFY